MAPGPQRGSVRVSCPDGNSNNGKLEVWTGTEWVPVQGVESISVHLSYNTMTRGTVIFDGIALDMMVEAERVRVEMVGPPKLPLGD